jgi:hypothetical protein
MKTINHTPKFIGLGSLLVLVLSFGTSATYAGPGVKSWLTPVPANIRTAEAAKPSMAAGMACPDAKTVAVTEVQQTSTNNKGPIAVVQTGTKRVCNSCDNATVMKSTMANGKGPLAAVATEHTCGSCSMGGK